MLAAQIEVAWKGAQDRFMPLFFLKMQQLKKLHKLLKKIIARFSNSCSAPETSMPAEENLLDFDK